MPKHSCKKRCPSNESNLMTAKVMLSFAFYRINWHQWENLYRYTAASLKLCPIFRSIYHLDSQMELKFAIYLLVFCFAGDFLTFLFSADTKCRSVQTNFATDYWLMYHILKWNQFLFSFSLCGLKRNRVDRHWIVGRKIVDPLLARIIMLPNIHHRFQCQAIYPIEW